MAGMGPISRRHTLQGAGALGVAALLGGKPGGGDIVAAGQKIGMPGRASAVIVDRKSVV